MKDLSHYIKNKQRQDCHLSKQDPNWIKQTKRKEKHYETTKYEQTHTAPYTQDSEKLLFFSSVCLCFCYIIYCNSHCIFLIEFPYVSHSTVAFKSSLCVWHVKIPYPNREYLQKKPKKIFGKKKREREKAHMLYTAHFNLKCILTMGNLSLLLLCERWTLRNGLWIRYRVKKAWSSSKKGK